MNSGKGGSALLEGPSRSPWEAARHEQRPVRHEQHGRRAPTGRVPLRAPTPRRTREGAPATLKTVVYPRSPSYARTMERMGATMRQLLVAFTVAGSLSLSLIGCSTPCKIVEDPNCDKTKTDHECLFICAPDNGEETDDSGEMNSEQESSSSESVGIDS